MTGPTCKRIAAAALLAALAMPASAFGWGLTAHRIVTEAAADRVPPDAGPFFVRIKVRLQELSVEPDTVLKARDPEDEGRKHFINLDALAPFPFDGIPRPFEEAQAAFGEETIRRNGMLPWRIQTVFKDLTASMKKRDVTAIARNAGWLSHYLADAFQPLHLTKNYDGQETCGNGIHAAFEREMIERNIARYRDAIRRSRPAVAAVDHPLQTIFKRMRDTYPSIEKLLEADRAATKSLKNDGEDYWAALERGAGPIADRQLAASADAVASFWYTAWLEAGRPPLPVP